MAFTVPTIADFKTYFRRDFPYDGNAQNDLSKVQDADITNALATTAASFNESLWSTQDKFSIAYLLLTAHNLVIALRASSQGIAGSGSWLETNKSVGSVSQGFTIPQKILDNPKLAMLSKTTYGMRYLELLIPLLNGQMFSVAGYTKP